jgi:hypothetical protein
VRLLGFERVELRPGESRQVSVTADPRLLAHFDVGAASEVFAANLKAEGSRKSPPKRQCPNSREVIDVAVVNT